MVGNLEVWRELQGDDGAASHLVERLENYIKEDLNLNGECYCRLFIDPKEQHELGKSCFSPTEECEMEERGLPYLNCAFDRCIAEYGGKALENNDDDKGGDAGE